jgi:hypothetical protein
VHPQVGLLSLVYIAILICIVLSLEAPIVEHPLPMIWYDVAYATVYTRKCSGLDIMSAYDRSNALQTLL